MAIANKLTLLPGALAPATNTVIQLAIAPAGEPVTDRPATRTAKTAKPTARAAAIVNKSPDISGAQLAAKLGLSERSGWRILATVKAQ